MRWVPQALLLSLLLIAWPSHAFAAKVLAVSANAIGFVVSHEATRKWQLGDRVCVLRKGNEIACGPITKSRAAGAVSKTSVNKRIASGNAANVKVVVGDLAQRARELSLDDGPESSYPIQEINPAQQTVVIPNLATGTWNLNDSICFTRKREDVACGHVAKFARNSTVVKLTVKRQSGTTAELLERPIASLPPQPIPKRKAASVPAPAIAPDKIEEPVAAKKEPGEAAEPSAAGDVTLGFDYTFPSLFFQFALFPKVSLGLSMLIIDYPPGKSGGTLRGNGALLSLNYYSDSHFRGTWLQAAGGMYWLKAENNGIQMSVSPIDFQVTLGWRWGFPNGMNLGFAVGVNYLSAKPVRPVIGDFVGVLPALVLDLGFML